MKISSIIIFASIILATCSAPQSEKKSHETKVLLNGVTTDILDNTINFPDSNAAITTAIRVFTPGECTGIHMHEGIPVVYVLEGELTISHQIDDENVLKVIKEGESFIGATNNWHETTNTSSENAVAIVVFIGSTDLKNTIIPPPPLNK